MKNFINPAFVVDADENGSRKARAENKEFTESNSEHRESEDAPKSEDIRIRALHYSARVVPLHLILHRSCLPGAIDPVECPRDPLPSFLATFSRTIFIYYWKGIDSKGPKVRLERQPPSFPLEINARDGDESSVAELAN